MSRWEPNARERLEQAALELFRERGFERTTVSEIAARAGLTERTFFRYFADKREVLFSGAGTLKDIFVSTVSSAPEATSPLDAVAKALEATSALFEERRDFARQRQAIIATHPELQERELIKLSSLATAIAEALRHRGVPEATATLTSEIGTAVFKLAFERWVHDAKRQELARHVRDSLSTLRAVALDQADAPPSTTTPRSPSPERRKVRRSSASRR
jgi:AcrR family transcriptional regulator